MERDAQRLSNAAVLAVGDQHQIGGKLVFTSIMFKADHGPFARLHIDMVNIAQKSCSRPSRLRRKLLAHIHMARTE